MPMEVSFQFDVKRQIVFVLSIIAYRWFERHASPKYACYYASIVVCSSAIEDNISILPSMHPTAISPVGKGSQTIHAIIGRESHVFFHMSTSHTVHFRELTHLPLPPV